MTIAYAVYKYDTFKRTKTLMAKFYLLSDANKYVHSKTQEFTTDCYWNIEEIKDEKSY